MAAVTDQNESPSAGVVIARKKRNFLADLLVRMMKEKPLGFLGLIIVLLMVFAGIFADWLAPYGWNEIIGANRLAPPGGNFLLGGDQLGRDVLSRIIYGARISMLVAFGAQAISLVTKLALGVPSGYFGGKYDLFLQRFIDAWLCFPSLLLYLTVMVILGPGIPQVILVLGISSGINGTRIIRSAVIRIKENTYFEAARAIGVPNYKILTRHVLPNISSIIIIYVAAGMGTVILQEAWLSFLGFGIPPPFPTWGGMLSGDGRRFMMMAPWLMLWPGLALSSVIFGFQMLADALRDLLDPRLRGGLGRYGGLSPKKLQKILTKRSGERYTEPGR